MIKGEGNMLMIGSSGKDVKELQNDLIDLGFGNYLGKYGADGKFGGATHNAVKAFQRWTGIKIDGIVGSITINNIYNKKKNAGLQGTYNFNISEFYCKDKKRTKPPNGMDSELLLKLERLRYECGNRPIIINSGYRTKEHNRLVGGVTNSQHLYARAADIVVSGVKPSTVYNKANKIFKNGGVGRYGTFTHVDTRGYRARF